MSLTMSSTDSALIKCFNNKTQRSPLIQPDFIYYNSRSPTLSFYSSSSPYNPSQKITSRISTSGLIGICYSKCENLQNDRTHCLLPSIAMEANESDNKEFRFGVHVMVDDSVGGGGGGSGKICGGGGNDADHQENDGVDTFYHDMIEANPTNSMILGNYAKYLKEVRGDFTKSKEYCSRSIIANPNDGSVLAMYAEMIWETQKDAASAMSYFERAVKASPHDSYVLASYAGFLWDAE